MHQCSILSWLSSGGLLWCLYRTMLPYCIQNKGNLFLKLLQRKHCHISKLRPPFDVGLPPRAERGEQLKAGGDEVLKSICIVCVVGLGCICPLYWTAEHSGWSLALFEAGLSAHRLNSFERRGWTESFSQHGKKEKKACSGRPTVRRWRKSQREGERETLL